MRSNQVAALGLGEAAGGEPFQIRARAFQVAENQRLSGDVEIGTQFNAYLDTPFGGYWSGLMFEDPLRNCDNLTAKCADSREVGQTFTSLTGVVGFSFDVHRVNPRSSADFEPNTLFAEDTCN